MTGHDIHVCTELVGHSPSVHGPGTTETRGSGGEGGCGRSHETSGDVQDITHQHRRQSRTVSSLNV